MIENRYLLSNRMEEEYVNSVMKRKVYIEGAFVFLVCLVFTLLSAFSEGKSFLYIYIGACCGCVLVTLTAPKKIVKDFHKSYLNRNGGKEVETVTTFTEAGIILREGENKSDFSYDDIVKVIITDSCCALMINKTSGLLIDKDGFKDVAFSEFLEFFKEKCSAEIVKIEKGKEVTF